MSILYKPCIFLQGFLFDGERLFQYSNGMFEIIDMPKWRNGRRTRLKISRWQHHVGSSPTFGTKLLPHLRKLRWGPQ